MKGKKYLITYEDNFDIKLYDGNGGGLSLDDFVEKINIGGVLSGINFNQIFDKITQMKEYSDNPAIRFLIRQIINVFRIGLTVGTNVVTLKIPYAEKGIDIFFLLKSISEFMKKLQQVYNTIINENDIKDFFDSLLNMEFTSPEEVEGKLEEIKENYEDRYENMTSVICTIINALIEKFASIMGDAIGTAIPYQGGVLNVVITESINLAFASGKSIKSKLYEEMINYYEEFDPEFKELLQRKSILNFMDNYLQPINDKIAETIESGDISKQVMDGLDANTTNQLLEMITEPILKAIIITIKEKPDNPLKLMFSLNPIGFVETFSAQNITNNIIKVFKNPSDYKDIDVKSMLNNPNPSMFEKLIKKIIEKSQEQLVNILKSKGLNNIILTVGKKLNGFLNIILFDENQVEEGDEIPVITKQKIAIRFNNIFALLFMFINIVKSDC